MTNFNRGALLLLPLLFVASLSSHSTAATFDGRPKIYLHLVPAAGQTGICALGAVGDCQGVITSGASSGVGERYFAFLLVARGALPSVAGLMCGIAYSRGHVGGESDGLGMDVLSWNGCAGVEFVSTEWPKNGGGNLITWDAEHCQLGELAVAGYFYVAAFGADTLSVTKRPITQTSMVADCQAVETSLGEDDLGFVVFSPTGVVPGCNSCLAGCLTTPVAATTWGGIKRLFGQAR